MSSKPGKKKVAVGSRQSAASKKKSAVGSPLSSGNSWLWKIAVSLAVTFLSFKLFPNLQFAYPSSTTFAGWFAVLMGGMTLWMMSKAFERRIKLWQQVIGIGFIVVLLVNASMQFRWVDGGGTMMSGVGSLFVIPLGVMWLMVLRQLKLADTQAPLKRRLAEEELKLADAQTPFKRQLPALLISFSAIVLIGAAVLFYRLGYYDFWEDEGLVINAAIGLRDDGMSYLKEGYDRAWMHTWIVSQSIQAFSESEWSARFPSACFGLLFIIIVVLVFYKWFRLPWLALMIPVVCLLTDELVILFRYTRMYALLIPVFLAGIYMAYRFVTSQVDEDVSSGKKRIAGFHVGYGAGALALLGIAIHLHPLAAIGFLAVFVMILLLAFITRIKSYWYICGVTAALGMIGMLLGYMDVEMFKLFPRAITRLFRPDKAEFAYYQFLFNNGLPANAVIMTLIGGTGLFFNPSLHRQYKFIIAFLYALIIMALIFMVHLMADTGRDYRYIAHLVPVVIGLTLYILHTTGSNFFGRRYGPLLLLIPLLYTAISFSREYKELYIKHVWSPRYTVAYADIEAKYQPGEAILYQNMKTYYLDPETLAGDKAFPLGRRKEMTLEQFKELYISQQKGWIVFDTHKSYHLNQEVLKYIIRHADKIHGSGVDDTGVELFYFNNDAAVSDD